MSSVNIYSLGGMRSMTLFLASSESSSVFGISLLILNYFQLSLNAKKKKRKKCIPLGVRKACIYSERKVYVSSVFNGFTHVRSERSGCVTECNAFVFCFRAFIEMCDRTACMQGGQIYLDQN